MGPKWVKMRVGRGGRKWRPKQKKLGPENAKIGTRKSKKMGPKIKKLGSDEQGRMERGGEGGRKKNNK
jgi:hypothetical protein